MTLYFLLPMACRDQEMEARLAAQEARLAAQEDRIRELASQVDQLAPTAITKDSSGRVTTVLSEDAAVKCAKTNLEGIAAAQRSYDAAFDNWGASFQEIGWQPEHAGDCSSNVAFTMDAKAAQLLNVPNAERNQVVAVAVITRGVGLGRSFYVITDSRVYELPNVTRARLDELLVDVVWTGGG